jgi:hypothetical protein
MIGCVGVAYEAPGQHITPRAEKTLVFGRMRFFYDGREFFPWNVGLVWPTVEPNIERHIWLLRLRGRAVSAELHPDPDGSLAIWLASGDYALLGSTQIPTWGTAPYEVVALFRVPAGPGAAYVGELIMRIGSHEGFHASFSEFGRASVEVQPIDTARATFEQSHGTLPRPPVVEPWCTGEHLPAFDDPELEARVNEILERGCAVTGESPS